MCKPRPATIVAVANKKAVQTKPSTKTRTSENCVLAGGFPAMRPARYPIADEQLAIEPNTHQPMESVFPLTLNQCKYEGVHNTHYHDSSPLYRPLDPAHVALLMRKRRRNDSLHERHQCQKNREEIHHYRVRTKTGRHHTPREVEQVAVR